MTDHRRITSFSQTREAPLWISPVQLNRTIHDRFIHAEQNAL
jgi:hypothetical protein